jgi:hypothetical protein
MTITRKVATVYLHTQDPASDTWEIAHNLGQYPIVDVYVTSNGTIQKIIPNGVTYVDANNCTVTFTSARAGHATVV